MGTVVAGEDSGEVGVGGESGPNGDEVVEELRLLGFERWAVEPGPGDGANEGEAEEDRGADHR
jgi:hypothetical protein